MKRLKGKIKGNVHFKHQKSVTKIAVEKSSIGTEQVIIIIIIYPLTARVLGTTNDFTTSFLHFFAVLNCPLGLGEL